MIIFDLDGTLADCEHRRHFVDPSKNTNYEECFYYSQGNLHSYGWFHKNEMLTSNPPQRKKFIPDWKSFYEACDQDTLIEPTIEILITLWIKEGSGIEIWS